MNFLGIGPLEFMLIFGVAMFFVGPKRLAEGVRNGRKYYTELRRYRQELTSLVTEAIDAEELKKELKETQREVWSEEDSKEFATLEKDLALDQGDLDIPELDITRPVPTDRSASRPKLVDRGDGKVDGHDVPSLGLKSGGLQTGRSGTDAGTPDAPDAPATGESRS